MSDEKLVVLAEVYLIELHDYEMANKVGKSAYGGTSHYSEGVKNYTFAHEAFLRFAKAAGEDVQVMCRAIVKAKGVHG